MHLPLKRRRPRRMSPAAAANRIELDSIVQRALAAPRDADQATPPRPQAKASTLTSPIVTTERFECPHCENRVALQDVTSRMDEHPQLHTLQRFITIDCQACGVVTDATLVLIGGNWSPETCEARKRSV